MMDQSVTDHPQTLPPPMAQYIPPSMPPTAAAANVQQHQQHLHQQPPPAMFPPQPQYPPQPPPQASAEQPPQAHYPPGAPSASDVDPSAAALHAQQQQMAAMMQMQQQQWGAGGYPSPFMMPFPPAMMMMPPQPGMDRPASRQSTRPPSRQSVNAAGSSSRSMVNGQTGGQSQTAALQGMLPPQGYPGFMPPGMYHPWFDSYWQSMYASYQNPYNFGYNDEMVKYMTQMSQREYDRYSQHSAAQSQSKQSQHSSSIQTWGSIDSLNDPFYQSHNPYANGHYGPGQQPGANMVKRPAKPAADPNALLTTSSAPAQQTPATQAKPKAAGNEEEEDDEDDDDDDDEDEDDDEEEDGSEEDSDDTSSDRFSIKSDLAQVNEESSKARRTPPLYIRPHLRAKFVFDQLLQVLPQSPSDTNQPATVEIISAASIHSMAPSLVEEQQLMSNFIGPLTASTAKSNVIRYCESQSQRAHKATHIIDRDALSILWQYMALLVKTNGVIDVRVDIPKILWSASSAPVVEEPSSQSHHEPASSTTLETSLREFLALGEIDTSVKFACENQLYTHALIISYLTDRQLFEKTIHNIISNLDNGDVLKTFYELGAGATPSVVSNVNKAHYGDWKRHLAVILANRTDANAQFVDLCVKTMGDTLVTSGRIYAGHFCYLIANIPFGSYRNNADKLAVIGSLHAGHSNLSFASIPNLQLTEVYEYSLRKTLTTFIPLKIYYTSKLVLHGLKREALAYCEEIGNTLIRQGNTSYVQLIDLQLFIMLAEKSRIFSRNFQLDPNSYKEPTWLLELRRIIQNLLDSAFLNKTVRDDSFTAPVPVSREPAKAQQLNPPTYPDMQTSTAHRQPEQATIPTVNYSNGYDPSSYAPPDQMSHSNPPAATYPNTLQVDTNVHYPSQPQSTYYPQQYYQPESQPADANSYPSQWNQQPQQPAIPVQQDHLNVPSQASSANHSFYQPPGDSSSYIPPNYTSTPNSHSTQQQWYPPGPSESRERLPSSEQSQQQQQMDSMRRRASIITFTEPEGAPPANWLSPSMTNSRRISSTSTQSNVSDLSPKTNSETTSFLYQQPQLMPYATNTQMSSMLEDTSQPQTNGTVKKKHACFDDSDDVFPNNPPKASDSKTASNTGTQAAAAAAAAQKSGMFGSIIKRLGLQRPAQAHLPDDRNKTLKFDEKTGKWIDTSKSADEQAAAAPKPPPMMSTTTTAASTTQPAPSFNPSMPPGASQQPPSSTLAAAVPPASTQPRTMSFAAGSTTIPNAAQPSQPPAAAWPSQSATNTAPAPAAQPPSQQPQQKAPAQLSAAQQRLQALRQQQQQQQQQAPAPPAASSNQYSLRSRPTQSRYVDVLASTRGAVAPNPNVSLNDLIPTPAGGAAPATSTNQGNNYFVPRPVQPPGDSHEQSSPSS